MIVYTNANIHDRAAQLRPIHTQSERERITHSLGELSNAPFDLWLHLVWNILLLCVASLRVGRI